MQTIAAQLDQAFRTAIRAAFDLDADPLIGVSQNEKFGDYQSNAAMGLAKQVSEKTGAKTNPRAVAEQVKAQVAPLLAEIASEISIAGPGFINVRLKPEWLTGRIVSGAAEGFRPSASETPQVVVVDYSGPNIAKEMHVGHLRSTIIGDAVARTLAFAGQHVIRQNHLGDWGTQFGRVVLAMWYLAVFNRSGRAAELTELIAQQQAAARQLSETKNKSAYEGAMNALVRAIVPAHRAFIAEDVSGETYFDRYLADNTLKLDELESAYVFVSAIVDAPIAATEEIPNERHGSRTLADLPKLITKFIQNRDHPQKWNEQEFRAWEKARRVTIDTCHEIYRRLHVQLGDPTVQPEPLERGESDYKQDLPDVVASLLSSGVAQESEGAIVVPVPGFEAPLIVRKGGKDEGFLYGTTDLAAVRYRVDRLRANRVLYFVDARQSQHFAQVFWTARAAGWAGNAHFEHAAFGTMLGEDGKPFKTRSGDTVKLKDLLDEAEERGYALAKSKDAERVAKSADRGETAEPMSDAALREIGKCVGIGAVKYSDLSKDRTSDYVFSWDRALAMDGNTAPYLQYAYARIRSIFRKAGIDPSTLKPDALRLEAPQEIALAKHILRLGEVIDLVARELKPHHLCAYLYDLATRFSSFYENCDVIKSDEPTRSSRLALCDVTARAIAQGLDLIGIEHPEQM